jgi:hypothetical protein
MKIPCFVISYNRPSFLKKCVEALAQEERLQVIVVANDGFMLTDTPDVLYNPMSDNHGHTVCWSQNLVPTDQSYIVTDCDIVVPSKLPWLDVLLSGMERLPKYNKFGLGLNTSQIPKSYPQRDQVLHHENKVIYKKNILDHRFIEAPVDTTLALYRAGYTKYSIWGNDSAVAWTGECRAVRTFAPYEATHLTWHMTKEELAGEEHQNYCKTINKNSTHWSAK